MLCEWAARPVLAHYGIGTNPVGTLADSVTLRLPRPRHGGPVALKVQSPDLPHKTEAGAVALNCHAEEVRAGYDDVCQRPSSRTSRSIKGVLVQPMAPPGREVILGIKRDATFGPMLMVGLGGIHVEVLQDVLLAPVPLAAERGARQCWPG